MRKKAGVRKKAGMRKKQAGQEEHGGGRYLAPLRERWSRGRRRRTGAYVMVRSLPRRHPVLSALTAIGVVVALSAGGYRLGHVPPCGPGMSAAGSSPRTCVGLDLDSGPMRQDDPLAGLEARIGTLDSGVTGPFDTVVLMEDMTPDPVADSQEANQVREAIEGAITAVRRANTTDIAGRESPAIKLLLASFGSGGEDAKQAVTEIVAHQRAEHIVAVTGIGQSLLTTRAAVAALSAHQITTIGADVTANDMNESPAGQPIADFFRVAPTNTDEVDIASRYIDSHVRHRRIMLIQDINPQDSYAQTLASAFQAAFGSPRLYLERYKSPVAPLVGISRRTFMIGEFANTVHDVCSDQPDLIYFAGRGTDLWSFLDALREGPHCPLGHVTIMTGDDGSNLVGSPLPRAWASLTVLFTALATAGEWDPRYLGPHPGPVVTAEAGDYQGFYDAFLGAGFPAADLADGIAMMDHDAVLVAVTAARDEPQPVSNPQIVASGVLGLHCQLTVPGAAGVIAMGTGGNPIDKVMPILQVNPSGTVTQEGPPQGADGPLDYFTSTCTGTG
jgi:ABC-type branched-subunit amino acid transport system substrate-binding protein